MKKQILAGIAGLAGLPAALAHCPLCTAAAAGAVGVARFYGVDDAIMGVLIGGLIVSSALWLNNWMKKKGWTFMQMQGTSIVTLSLIITIISFKIGGLFTGLMLWGMPRLLAGMLFGTGAVMIGESAHYFIRAQNNGRNLIALQGMNIMLASLLIASAIFAGRLL